MTPGNSACSAPLLYTSTRGTCQTEFSNILTSSNCSPDSEGGVLVTMNNESLAMQLITGLTIIGASAECKKKAAPFLCQFLFGLCGDIGISIQPTSSQCEDIKDTLCQGEWMIIEKLGIPLPDCGSFPPEASSCSGLNSSVSVNSTDMSGTVIW